MPDPAAPPEASSDEQAASSSPPAQAKKVPRDSTGWDGKLRIGRAADGSAKSGAQDGAASDSEEEKNEKPAELIEADEGA
jgi:hypothetical protein